MFKKIVSILCVLTLMVMPFSGLTFVASASNGAPPTVAVNIAPYAAVTPATVITVEYAAASGATLTACDTRLEGTSLGTGTSVSFTPAAQALETGLYTLIMEATDSLGNQTIESLTFRVQPTVELSADAAGATVSTFEADALNFTASYGTTTDGTIDLDAVSPYGALSQYDMRYTSNAVSASSSAGIPYQTFDINLAGQTTGKVAVNYEGSTKDGERIAVKVYDPTAAQWNTIGSFTGTGSVSASLDIATYNDGGAIHVAAVLDYVTNGADTLIWTTDPQHYTKFADLNEYYYKIYRYAAAEYEAGNIGYILNTGDLVDDRPYADVAAAQWGVADRAMTYVEAVDCPNGLVSGNHDVGDYNLTDYTGGDNTSSDYSMFWKTFPATRYNNEAWYGGSLNNNVSHYDLVTIGNVDFIILYLGYGLEATDETIAWANDVLATYRHRTAIIATHEYLDSTQAIIADTGRGQLIYDEIIDPNPNVKMVLCGHDDGSLCLEKTASDGRTVYELLSDYQFVEAEDPSFYQNEHWIGSVPHCCGDGYLRLMTVEGDQLSSITYSPVTDRYNPYGDREVFTLDLDCDAADRTLACTGFSAAILGDATTDTTVDRVSVITDGTSTTYTAVTYATVPAAPAEDSVSNWTAAGEPATPDASHYAHTADAPYVGDKVDVLELLGLGAHPTVDQWRSFGNQQMNLTIDLVKTPYLYYSVDVPTGSYFTFSFISDMATAPYLTFLDASKGNATLNSGAANWNAYQNREQYITASETGCIDMRTMLTDANATTWTIQNISFYNAGAASTLGYFFFGAAPVSDNGATYGAPATTASPFFTHAAMEAPAVVEKVDLLAAIGFGDHPTITATSSYAANGLTIDMKKTPYLYYSVAQGSDSNFNFAFISDLTYSPWLTFRDATKGGATMNSGAGTWDTYTANEHYMTTSETGCIDMRALLNDPNAATWIINEIRFYNTYGTNVTVNYLFFGSASLDACTEMIAPADTAALSALLGEANAIDTSVYTAASVTPLTEAIVAATLVDKTDASAVSAAYMRLASAIGGLTVPESGIDESTLTSVKNYSFLTSDWYCQPTSQVVTNSGSWLDATQTDDGIFIAQSANATHIWPSMRYVGSGYQYTVNPNGGVYLKLDVDANTNWMIEITVTQGNQEAVVRPNEAIAGAFHDSQTNGWEGIFQGVYDISQAFYDVGMDPTATFTVTRTLVYVIGNGGNGTFNHLEMMTEPAPATVDRTALSDLIVVAYRHTQSLYTADSYSAMQTALTAAQTAYNNSTLSQAQVNLAAWKLQTALDALVAVDTLVAEPTGSLLPADTGLWNPSTASEITVTRTDDPTTIVENTVAGWPNVDYVYPRAVTADVQKDQIAVNMTVSTKANVLLLIDGTWISLSPYITDALDDNDITAGDYAVEIPLSSIAELNGKDSVTITATRVFAVDTTAASKVTIRELVLETADRSVLDEAFGPYGKAATPANPFYAHAASEAPAVAHKVDILEAIPLDAHPLLQGWSTYGASTLNLTVDLAKTPYLYYSFAQGDATAFTFALVSDTATAPWLSFLDCSGDTPFMNSGAENWNSYQNAEQFATGSMTGCIDMRELLLDPANTTWIVNQLNIYANGAADMQVGYLFFGSEPLAADIPDQEPVETVEGDVNADGVLTTADARMTLNEALAGNRWFTDAQNLAADMNDDGKINTTDVRMMLQTIALDM